MGLLMAVVSWLGVVAAAGQVSPLVGGFVTLRVRGHGGQSSSALSFLSLGLVRPVLFQGTIEGFEAVSGQTILTDAEADWGEGQFNGVNGPHYLELTSGPAAGMRTDVAETRAVARSLAVADDLTGLLREGDAYKVRKHWTLGSLFGPNNQAGLGAGSLTTADEVLLFDARAKVYRTYFYKTSGLGGVGWRSTASATADQTGAKIDLTQGILIRRKQAADLEWKLFGSVKSGPTLVDVHPGLNIVGNIRPSDTLTLGTSGLYTGDPATGLAGGSNVSADKILIFDGAGYQTYYYKTLGLGGTGWRSTASASTDASGTVLPGGTGLLIQRINDRPGFFWAIDQP